MTSLAPERCVKCGSLTTGATRVVARYLEGKAPTGPAKGWERRKENDDFAKMNIPEKYHMLWEKEKRFYKGTPDQRSEQFMEWVGTGSDMGENRDSLGEGDEVNNHLLMEQAEKDLRKHEQQERKEQKCRDRCPSCYSDDNAEDAPF